MKNKKTFELPEHLPMDTKNFVRNDCVRELMQAEDHTDFLRKQIFCLSLMKFFTEFPGVNELILSCQKQGGEYFLNIIINGKEDDSTDSMFVYFEDNISDLDKEKLKGLGDRDLIVKKDNIQAAWEEWMGEENYQKWKSLDMEDKLREHIKPTGEYKQKKKMV